MKDFNLDENLESDLHEAHSAEWEGSYEIEGGASQEEINAAIVSDVRDNIELFSQEDLEALRCLVEQYPLDRKERVYQEAAALGEKIDRLHRFLNGRNSDGIKLVEEVGLTDAAVLLMQKQEEYMKEYYNCLVARYSIWDYKKEK